MPSLENLTRNSSLVFFTDSEMVRWLYGKFVYVRSQAKNDLMHAGSDWK